MNQQTPPPNHSDGDSKPDGGTAPERIERPSSAEPTERYPSTDAGSAPDQRDEPQPRPEALAGWEEPQPEVGEAAPRSSGRWDEPRPSSGGTSSGGTSSSGTSSPGSSSSRPSWEEPHPSGAQYHAEGPREARRRHPAEEHFFSKRTWTRVVFVVLFAIAWWIAEFVLTAVVVIQFIWVLFSGEPNEKLRGFGQSLSRYAYQIFRYMTFNSDERPFPFDLDWPSGGPDSTSS